MASGLVWTCRSQRLAPGKGSLWRGRLRVSCAAAHGFCRGLSFAFRRAVPGWEVCAKAMPEVTRSSVPGVLRMQVSRNFLSVERPPRRGLTTEKDLLNRWSEHDK